MKLIDTNVFIYAAGRPSEFQEGCIRVLRLYGAGELEANINTEVIQEAMYSLWNRKLFQEAVAMADRLLTTFPEPLPVSIATMKHARNVFSMSPEIGPRGSIHAAVVLENQLEGIISIDGDFDDIPGITRFDPLEF